jgi:hypothetical protein
VQVKAADAWRAFPPWTRGFLEFRRDAYAAAHDPRLAQAECELREFIADEDPDWESAQMHAHRKDCAYWLAQAHPLPIPAVTTIQDVARSANVVL